MNTLTITYRSGESRILHPTQDFFKAEPAPKLDRKTGKVTLQMLSMAEKCMDIAESLATHPYKVLLEREGGVQFERTFHGNEPMVKPKQIQGERVFKVDESKVKKELRREVKRINAPVKVIFHGAY